MTNNVILIGRLTADPKDKYTQDGTQVCKFTLAVNGKNKTNKQERMMKNDAL